MPEEDEGDHYDDDYYYDDDDKDRGKKEKRGFVFDLDGDRFLERKGRDWEKREKIPMKSKDSRYFSGEEIMIPTLVGFLIKNNKKIKIKS